jgi:Fe-S-cluster-containing hydrogenase component 2
MTPDEAYKTLMAQMRYPNSARFRALLENLMTPEQAMMVACLPGTVQEVAEKLGMDVETVQKGLDDTFVKGVTVPKGDYITREFFNFARSVQQLHDRTQASKLRDVVKDKEFYDLWHDFVMNEYYGDAGKRYAMMPRPMLRIIPAYLAIKDLPDVQPYENYRELLKMQELIAVVPCSCRHRTTSAGVHCGHTSEENRQNCILFGRSADYNIKRGSGTRLTIEEALKLCDEMEKDGLLHMWGNSKSMAGTTSCNCCRDCCMNSLPMQIVGAPIGKIWEKSRYLSIVDQTKCIGCQDCLDHCQFDAINMVKPESSEAGKKSKKLKAQIIDENCFGCGACVVNCDQQALSMKCIRPMNHIPDPMPGRGREM